MFLDGGWNAKAFLRLLLESIWVSCWLSVSDLTGFAPESINAALSDAERFRARASATLVRTDIAYLTIRSSAAKSLIFTRISQPK